MVNAKLSRLERAARKLGGGRCRLCGSPRPGGVAQVPRIECWAEWTVASPHWGDDGRCVRCGSEPSHVIRVVTPELPADDDLELGMPTP